MVSPSKATWPSLDVVFILDISRRPEGESSRAALNAVRRIVKEALRPHDKVSIILFSDDVQRALIRTPLSCIKWGLLGKKFSDDGEGGLRVVGCTALWDAVVSAMTLVHKRKFDPEHDPPHPYIVVLTDGEDNSSDTDNIKKVREGILRKPSEHELRGKTMAHLHLLFLAVGDSAKACIEPVITDDGGKLPPHIKLHSSADVHDEAGLDKLLHWAGRVVADFIIKTQKFHLFRLKQQRERIRKGKMCGSSASVGARRTRRPGSTSTKQVTRSRTGAKQNRKAGNERNPNADKAHVPPQPTEATWFSILKFVVCCSCCGRPKTKVQ